MNKSLILLSFGLLLSLSYGFTLTTTRCTGSSCSSGCTTTTEKYANDCTVSDGTNSVQPTCDDTWFKVMKYIGCTDCSCSGTSTVQYLVNRCIISKLGAYNTLKYECNEDEDSDSDNYPDSTASNSNSTATSSAFTLDVLYGIILVIITALVQ